MQQKRAVVQEIKLVHGEDTKVCRFQGGEVTYALLQEQVAQKFPGLGPARLSYVDREGERVVVSSRDDVLAALEVALMQAVEQGGPRLAAMPPARLNVEPCAEAEVPPPPPEEAKQLEQMRQMRKYIDELQERQLKARMEALQQQASAGSELVEIDSWVVQLAQLVREQLNIDPDRHVDLQQEGWEHVSQALDKVLVSDEAVQLFEQGIGKFKEVVALGHLNWGHAHLGESLATDGMGVLAQGVVAAGIVAAGGSVLLWFQWWLGWGFGVDGLLRAVQWSRCVKWLGTAFVPSLSHVLPTSPLASSSPPQPSRASSWMRWRRPGRRVQRRTATRRTRACSRSSARRRPRWGRRWGTSPTFTTGRWG